MQTITITVTDDGVQCSTELLAPELVFWLEYVKAMVLDDVMGEKSE
jgi:hypothetical protein